MEAQPLETGEPSAKRRNWGPRGGLGRPQGDGVRAHGSSRLRFTTLRGLRCPFNVRIVVSSAQNPVEECTSMDDFASREVPMICWGDTSMREIVEYVLSQAPASLLPESSVGQTLQWDLDVVCANSRGGISRYNLSSIFATPKESGFIFFNGRYAMTLDELAYRSGDVILLHGHPPPIPTGVGPAVPSGVVVEGAEHTIPSTDPPPATAEVQGADTALEAS